MSQKYFCVGLLKVLEKISLRIININPALIIMPIKLTKTRFLKILNCGIKIMLVASYFEKRKPAVISQKTGIKALFLPLSVGVAPEISDNFKLVDYWIQQINEAIHP